MIKNILLLLLILELIAPQMPLQASANMVPSLMTKAEIEANIREVDKTARDCLKVYAAAGKERCFNSLIHELEQIAAVNPLLLVLAHNHLRQFHHLIKIHDWKVINKKINELSLQAWQWCNKLTDSHCKI